MLAAAAAVVIVVAIGASRLTANSSPRSSASKPAILADPPRPTSFSEVSRAIDALYRNHPAIAAYEAHGVEYNATTRHKVLSVCSEGSIAATAAQLETERVMACAPLIYYFASYGRQNSAPEAIDAARLLYWYAATSNRTPYDAAGTLTGLLHSWGIR
jgi:hypothetical protein